MSALIQRSMLTLLVPIQYRVDHHRAGDRGMLGEAKFGLTLRVALFGH